MFQSNVYKSEKGGNHHKPVWEKREQRMAQGGNKLTNCIKTGRLDNSSELSTKKIARLKFPDLNVFTRVVKPKKEENREWGVQQGGL